MGGDATLVTGGVRRGSTGLPLPELRKEVPASPILWGLGRLEDGVWAGWGKLVTKRSTGICRYGTAPRRPKRGETRHRLWDNQVYPTRMAHSVRPSWSLEDWKTRLAHQARQETARGQRGGF